MNDLIKKFWARVDNKDRGLYECWPWIGNHDNRGYGRLYVKKIGGLPIYKKAYRFSWEIHFGSIPKGLGILHQCDNPNCVNPNHLFVGTQRDNLKDAISKKRNSWARNYGEMGGRCKFPDKIIIRMRMDFYQNKMNINQLVEKYSISNSWIRKIIRNGERSKSISIREVPI